MRVWLFKDGESLPLQTDVRRMRMGMLAAELVRRGHSVDWFASTFLHAEKELLCHGDQVYNIDQLRLHLIFAGSFRKTLSFRRFLFYRRYAERIRVYCGALPRPDVIVTAFPLIDVAHWAVRYAKTKGIPIAVDVRDLWPDTIVEALPMALRPVASVALRRDFKRTKEAFREADSLCAMSNGVLRWALSHGGRAQRAADVVFPIGYPAIAPLDPVTREQIPAEMKGKIAFTYVGSFGFTYDLQVLVSAAKRLRDDPRVVIVLVGDGPQMDAIREATSDLPNILLTGWLGQKETRAILGASRAGLLPWAGVRDAMPNKFFDYVANGVPVISSAAGELNTAIQREGAGATFEVKDDATLAKTIVRLADEVTHTEGMRRRAIAWFEREFREADVYRKFGDHVEQLCAR